MQRSKSGMSLWCLLALAFFTGASTLPPVMAGESTMPASYNEKIKPELADKYTYTECGEYTKAVNIPTYEWMPVGTEPKEIVLAIHGLTLHGRRFRVIARSLATHGMGLVSMDMRGFGGCYFGDADKYSTKEDDKKEVNHHKSYDEIVQIATMIKAKYPNVPLVAMGESLGCTFCVRLAAEHPDLIKGIILSAPAVHLNSDMYAGKGQIRQGIKAIVVPSHELDMSHFFTDLVSDRADVKNEMVEDPYIRKQLKLRELIATDAFVDETAKWGKKTDPKLAVLILQGNKDGCVSPKHVVDLMNNMASDDQTLDWRGNYGHLQLETVYMRASIIDAVGNWMRNHNDENRTRMADLQANIADLGGFVQQ